MATALLRSGSADSSSSWRVPGSPLWYSVGPWPAILGWTSSLYSSIKSSRSSSVASLPLPRRTPSGVASLRVADTTYLGLASSLTAHSRMAGSLLVAAGDGRPVALHHLVGDATPQHRPALVHEAGEEGVCLVVGDSLLVVDAAVQGDVDAEGQKSHGVLRSRYATRRSAVWLQPIAASFRWRTIGAESASSGSATRCATGMRVPRAVATSSVPPEAHTARPHPSAFSRRAPGRERACTREVEAP